MLGPENRSVVEVIRVMAGMSGRRIGVVLCALFALGSSIASASEEAVDRTTQQALELDAHPEHGASVFRESCARCHGVEAQGDAARAIPALASQRFKYIVRQLANFAGAERDSATMHHVITQNELREPQTWVDIAAYLNNVPMTRRAQTGDGAHIGLGRGIFHEQCASCHRPDAHGDTEGFIPSLRNQHFSYLVAQLQKLAEGNRHNVDEDLVRFLRSFDDEEIRATADYLSRLPALTNVHKAMRHDGTVVD
jgi:cytochrome c553